MNQYAESPFGSVARLEIERAGERMKIEVNRMSEPAGFFFNPIVAFRHATFSELRPRIFYVNLPALDAPVSVG